MVNEALLRQVVKSLDTESQTRASEAIDNLLKSSGDKVEAVAAKLAQLMVNLETASGKQAGLQILVRYKVRLPEAIEFSIQMSKDEDSIVRRAALSYLTLVDDDPKARSRIFELIDDAVKDVRDDALSAVATMDGLEREVTAGPDVALKVIPDDQQRDEALRLLDELKRAVRTLEDLGLDDAQHEIADKLIYPKIEELKRLFDASAPDAVQVVEARKKGMIGLSSALTAAQALTIAATGVANADEAVSNVVSAVSKLQPVVDIVGRLTS